MYKRDYMFRMNVMEEIFEIRSCIEIPARDGRTDGRTDTLLCLLPALA